MKRTVKKFDDPLLHIPSIVGGAFVGALTELEHQGIFSTEDSFVMINHLLKRVEERINKLKTQKNGKETKNTENLH